MASERAHPHDTAHEHAHPTVPTLDEHAAALAELVAPALAAARDRVETLPLLEAQGRVTSRAVASPVDLPLFRNSQMDGFAVRAADLAGAPVTLPIVGEVAATAGEPAPLAPGTAVRIMTGAPVPEGADAVVPVERTTGDRETVEFSDAVAAGQFVRERGSDLRAGDELLPAGRRLEARHLAALAASGLDSVEVTGRVRVAAITTGSELVPVGQTPGPGEIHDANAVALAAAITAAGADVAFSARVVDDTSSFEAALAQAVASADIVVTSGGISHGDYEVVREALEPRGAWVGHVAMQPGGPQATALIDGIPVLCFPGNPVSTQISFAMFLAPLLRDAAGLPRIAPVPRALAAAVTSPAGKRQLLRGVLDPDGRARTVAGPGSHLVAALAAAEVLIDIPQNATAVAEGETVTTWPL